MSLSSILTRLALIVSTMPILAGPSVAAETDRDMDALLAHTERFVRAALDHRNLDRLPSTLRNEPNLALPKPVKVVESSPKTKRGRSAFSLKTDLHAGEMLVPVNMSQVIEIDGRYDEVSIGNPEIADVVPLSTSSIYVFGKQFGTTSLTVTGSEGEIMAVVDLVVSFNIEELKQQLHELVPGHHFEVRPAHDGLVLSGQVSNAAALDRALAIASRFAPDRVTNLVEITGSQQVMLAVRFAEVERSVVKQLGFTNALEVDGNDAQALVATGDGVAVNPASFAIVDLAATIGDVTIDALLDTLEDKGVIKTLAEPNLIALSGDSAQFLAGGEFPIPVGRDEDDDGVDITIEFKEFGVSLSFTPTVLASDFINLELFTGGERDRSQHIDPRGRPCHSRLEGTPGRNNDRAWGWPKFRDRRDCSRKTSRMRFGSFQS